MKLFLKTSGIILTFCILITVCASCSNNGGGNTESTTSKENSPASIETRDFFSKYYNELNNKNFAAVSDCFSEDAESLKSKIDNFTFMSSLFNVKYEIDSAEGVYLEDGNISASLVTLITSKNIETGAVTVMKEPSTYLITKTGDKLIITSYAVGESEIVSMN